MDEFGVLTERFSLKPQGKPAPMFASRPPPVLSPAGAFDFNAYCARGRSPPSSSFDYFDSVFSAAKPSSADDDVFGFFVSKPAPVVDNLLGDFGLPLSRSLPRGKGQGESMARFDNLMPGFGSSSSGFTSNF